jgi:hypothetical protein
MTYKQIKESAQDHIKAPACAFTAFSHSKLLVLIDPLQSLPWPFTLLTFRPPGLHLEPPAFSIYTDFTSDFIWSCVLNTINSLMTPRFLSPTWTCPMNSRSSYRTTYSACPCGSLKRISNLLSKNLFLS